MDLGGGRYTERKSAFARYGPWGSPFSAYTRSTARPRDVPTAAGIVRRITVFTSLKNAFLERPRDLGSAEERSMSWVGSKDRTDDEGVHLVWTTWRRSCVVDRETMGKGGGHKHLEHGEQHKTHIQAHIFTHLRCTAHTLPGLTFCPAPHRASPSHDVALGEKMSHTMDKGAP